MMKIELNIEKKHFWATLATIVFLSIGILAYANNGNHNKMVGHPVSNLDWRGTIPSISAINAVIENVQVKHIDAADTLYIQSYSPGKGVVIGSSGVSNSLTVYGQILAPSVCINGVCKASWPDINKELDAVMPSSLKDGVSWNEIGGTCPCDAACWNINPDGKTMCTPAGWKQISS